MTELTRVIVERLTNSYMTPIPRLWDTRGGLVGVKMWEQRHHMFSNRVLHGKLRKVVRFFYKRESVGGPATQRTGIEKNGHCGGNRRVGPGGKTPTQKHSSLFHVGGVQRNAYFHTRGHYRGCGRIGRTKSFGSSGPGGTYSEALQGCIL